MTEFDDNFQPPVAHSNRSPDLASFVSDLKDNPGKWGKLPRSFPNKNAAKSFRQRLSNGGNVHFRPSEHFEVSPDETRLSVMVRYVGGPQQ